MLLHAVNNDKTVNVLIVDDDRSTQRVLADALSRQGFTITVERDGDWALKSFEKKRFDLVLLDLLLPGTNGYEVAKKLRALPRGKRVPIVMISGVYKNAVHIREAVQKHGAFALLEKPVRLPVLYDTLREALGDAFPEPKPDVPPPPPVEDDEVTGEHLADSSAYEEKNVVETASRRTNTGSFQVIRGDFSQRSFAEVLAEIYRWKGSGALLLRREKVKKIVFFRDGVPQSVKSNLLSECLGRVMMREKMISEAECEESLKRMKAKGRQQGTVLIEMGCISPHNLQYALKLQLQTKLYDVFAWDQGDYQFNPKAELPPDTIALEQTCAQIIHAGVRLCYDENRLARWWAQDEHRFVHPSEHPLYALQDAGLGEDEKQLLNAVDGHKTVATMKALSILSPLDTDRLLFAMKCAQMIEVRDRPAEGKPKINMAKLAEAALKEAPAGAQPPPLPPKLPHAPPPPKGADLPLPWPEASAPTFHAHAASPSVEGLAPTKGAQKGSARAPTLEPSSPAARHSGSLLPELSTVTNTSRLSGEESLKRERLANKVAAMRKLDYFEILGVPTTATREEIKRAYFALAKEYHPDKHFGSSSAEVRQLAQQLYDLISSAHDTLTDPVERDRYLKEVAAGVKREMGDDVGKILAAEGKFQKGEDLMRSRNYAGAHALFKEAIALYKDEGEFHAWLGWSAFQLDPTQPETIDEAVANIEHAISLNPKIDKPYLFLGYIYKATGRPDKAEKQFEKAIQANPDCTEALRELRLLGKARK